MSNGGEPWQFPATPAGSLAGSCQIPGKFLAKLDRGTGTYASSQLLCKQ